jgi:hypothetical protein
LKLAQPKLPSIPSEENGAFLLCFQFFVANSSTQNVRGPEKNERKFFQIFWPTKFSHTQNARALSTIGFFVPLLSNCYANLSLAALMLVAVRARHGLLLRACATNRGAVHFIFAPRREA